MSLRSDFDALLAAISPQNIVVTRSAEVDIYFVIVEDRRLNGKSFDRVGTGKTLAEAAAKCLERWNRATPAEIWREDEAATG